MPARFRGTPAFGLTLLGGLALAATLACTPQAQPRPDAPTPLARGAYLATVGGCHDCHTPKHMTERGPELDRERLLAGYLAVDPVPEVPAGAIGPGRWGALTNASLTAWAGPWGVSFSSNLTPHDTGLGGWSADTFIATIRNGRHAGVGRPLLPPMPWPSYAQMSDEDLRALFAYLQSLPPVDNRVPLPQPPSVLPPLLQPRP